MPKRSPRGKPYHKPTRTKEEREQRESERRSTQAGEHLPVMLQEVLLLLNPQPGQVIVDCTLGFAGHSLELLKAVGPSGQLIACDLDPENLPRAELKLKEVGHPFSLHHGNFAGLTGVLGHLGVTQVDGLLADLGVSSMQLDEPSRGFSFMRDGPLDMRMDPSRGKTAAELLATMPLDELIQALQELGDEPKAEEIARAIVKSRADSPLRTTLELRKLIELAAPVYVLTGEGQPSPRKQQLLPTTRVFQALRILVNRELANLTQLLRVLPEVLRPGGVASFISFHSGEDRLLKASFKEGLRAGIYSEISEEPLRPTEEEKSTNPRSRSAKLRWARRKRELPQ